MKYLTTGGFAKLCGTQKGTLLFYDKEGLLKPKYVSENGYRRYGVEQFYDFDMISMLKDAGSSLKEIKSYLSEKDYQKILELFEEKKRQLEQERTKLVRRQKMLDDTLTQIKEAVSVTYGVLEVVEMDTEALELVPASAEEQATAASFISVFIEFANRFESQGRYAMSPFGALTKKENVIKGQFIDDYYFCGAGPDTAEDALHIKPKGRYAVFYHSGDLDSHAAAYIKMLEGLEKSGLKIVGNMYAYEMASYFVTGSTDKYMSKFCVQVK